MSRRTALSARAAAFALSVALLAAPSVARAAVVPLDFSAMSKKADAVVVGTVVGSRSHFATGAPSTYGALIVTDTRVEVQQTASGSRPREITITQPGGVVGAIGLAVDDLPTFSAGEQCALFLDAHNSVVGGYQGKLGVRNGKIVEYGAAVSELPAMVRSARAGVRVRRVDPATAGVTASVTTDSQTAGASSPAGTSAVAGASAAPVISTIAPSKAIAGLESVTITGAGFGATQGPGFVAFNDGRNVNGGLLPATVTSWSDTAIECVVPAFGASGNVFVRNAAGGTSAGAQYDTSFSADGKYWGTMPATYRINENAPTMTGEGAEIRAAFATWNAVTPKFQIAADTVASNDSAYPTGTTFAPYNAIFVANDLGAADSLAENLRWYDPQTGEVVRSVIVLNGAIKWGATAVPSADIYDLQSVVLHELGHTVGLLDQYPNTWRVMGAYDGANKRVLTADEIAGVEYLYLSTSSWSGALTDSGLSRVNVGYHQPISIRATLLDPSGSPTSSPLVVLQASTDGRNFGDVAGATLEDPAGGAYRATVSPESRTYYRFAFKGDGVMRRSYSGVVQVTPGVHLTGPYAKTTVRARKAFSVSGTLMPRHSTGSHSVRIKLTKKKGRKWVYAGAYWARNYNITGGTRYSLKLKLRPGTYRIYAEAPADAGHWGTGFSAPRKVVVK